MLGLLLDQQLVLGPGRATLAEVLHAAAWVVGEYAALLPAVAASAWKRAKEVHLEAPTPPPLARALQGRRRRWCALV